MGIKGIVIVEISTEEIRASVANVSEKMREAIPRWLGFVDRKTEKDVQ